MDMIGFQGNHFNSNISPQIAKLRTFIQNLMQNLKKSIIPLNSPLMDEFSSLSQLNKKLKRILEFEREHGSDLDKNSSEFKDFLGKKQKILAEIEKINQKIQDLHRKTKKFISKRLKKFSPTEQDAIRKSIRTLYKTNSIGGI